MSWSNFDSFTPGSEPTTDNYYTRQIITWATSSYRNELTVYLRVSIRERGKEYLRRCLHLFSSCSYSFFQVIHARTPPTFVTVGESHLCLHLNMYIYICIYVYTTSTSTSTIVQQALNMRPAIFLHDTTSPYRFLLLVSLKVHLAGNFAVDWGRFAHTRSHML